METSRLSSAFGLKSSRHEQQMTKPGINVEIVNRPTDRLVEAFDAFAVPASLIHGDTSRIVRENHICVAPRRGTTVAL